MTMPQRKWTRLLAALAMLSLGPAVLFVEAEMAAHQARSAFSNQTGEYEHMLAQLHRKPVSCSAVTQGGRLSVKDIIHLIGSTLSATCDVNRAFQSDALFWSFENRLPWTSGLYAVYDASGVAQDQLSHLKWNLDLCREVPEDDDASLRQEEKRSQTWLDAQRAKLKELYDHLKAAKAAYERDRPKLTAAAWSLGFLQVVGWGLLCLVVLPHDIRSWRARRAEMKKGGGAT
jgi:hypothetical protein